MLVLLSTTSHGQVHDSDYNKFSLELNAGFPAHFGDVKQNPYWPALNEYSFAGGLGLNYHFSPAFTMRGSFMGGQLVGRNDVTNLHFENNFMEFATKGVLNLNQLFVPQNPLNETFSIYGVMGVGVIGYRTRLMTLDSDQVLEAYGYCEEGVNKEAREWDMVIPFGMGFKFRVSDRFDIGLESAFRYTKTDKLDAVNRSFSANDMYNYTSVGITLRLGRNTNSAYWARASKIMYPGDSQRMEVLSHNYTEARADVIRLEKSLDTQSYDGDIAELRQMVRSLEKKNNELVMRLHDLENNNGNNGSASVSALMSVYFKINSAALDAVNYERVAAAARLLQSQPDLKIKIVGHADQTGPDRFNRVLSERRANMVHNVLVNDFRIDPTRLLVSFNGTEDPLSDNNLNVNRRVDFVVFD